MILLEFTLGWSIWISSSLDKRLEDLDPIPVEGTRFPDQTLAGKYYLPKQCQIFNHPTHMLKVVLQINIIKAEKQRKK